MDDKTKLLVKALREDAEWAQANEWETPIALGDNLNAAANLIEKLTDDRDALKRRAEAAERDIASMLESCQCEVRHEYCARSQAPGGCNTDECNGYAIWRGPCAENGGK